jgi:hypothetical protein
MMSYRAFITYDSADSIANMPFTYGVPINFPIVSTSNITIANDWADLMDGSIAMGLSDALVTFSDWWSGAGNTDGSGVSVASCNQWTDSTNLQWGQHASMVAFDFTWIQNTFVVPCDQNLALLCIAW